MSHDIQIMTRKMLEQQIAHGRSIVSVPFYDLVPDVVAVARSLFIGAITNANSYDADTVTSWRITLGRFPAGPAVLVATTEFFIRNPVLPADRALWVGGRHVPPQLRKHANVITIEELKL
jgi:hypothetical protein